MQELEGKSTTVSQTLKSRNLEISKEIKKTTDSLEPTKTPPAKVSDTGHPSVPTQELDKSETVLSAYNCRDLSIKLNKLKMDNKQRILVTKELLKDFPESHYSAMKYINTLHSIITIGSSYIFRNNYDTYLQFHIVYCRDVIQHKVQVTTSQLHMMLLV